MTEIDLNVDLNNIDLSRPLLAPGRLRLNVADCTIAPTKKGGSQLKLTLKNDQDVPVEDGTTVAPGACTVFHNLLLTPTGGMTSKMIVDSVAALVQSTGCNPGSKINDAWCASLKGRACMAQVGVEEESSGTDGKVYPRKNVIKYFIVPRR